MDIDASYTYAGDSRYEVRLTMRERHSDLLEIRMLVPDKETALGITRRWKEENAEVYRFLIEKLS